MLENSKLPQKKQDILFTFGSRLGRARLNKKLTIDEISKRTYISKDFFTDLEAQNYDRLPAQAYTIGFLRSYCQILDISPDEYIDEYKQYIKSHKSTQSQQNITQNMTLLQNQGRKRSYIFIFSLCLMIVGVLATVGFVVYQKSSEQNYTEQTTETLDTNDSSQTQSQTPTALKSITDNTDTATTSASK